ncbi:heterokaryon incompatibility protein [Colletotrichum kahawae]|uniref:Heterokaryon incompatibility protein n=1 Tax=Colletotrichum kahawae TaxID=34407 RepID=A0AAD9YTJ0_COLKA|nr:heterokaryon incompatibility protein [Colletotrichum kahawae]
MSHLRQPRDVELLLKTFREVFDILRRLGIRYIWIDRFCIVQDSEADWQTQASVMGEIYKTSFVCISGLGAPDDDAGCFYD